MPFPIIEIQGNNVNEDQNGNNEDSIERQNEDENSPSNDDDQKNSWKNAFKNVFKNCYNSVQNMDIPLNRFLVFTGYYFIFLAIILTTILLKNDMLDDSER